MDPALKLMLPWFVIFFEVLVIGLCVVDILRDIRHNLEELRLRWTRDTLNYSELNVTGSEVTDTGIRYTLTDGKHTFYVTL